MDGVVQGTGKKKRRTEIAAPSSGHGLSWLCVVCAHCLSTCSSLVFFSFALSSSPAAVRDKRLQQPPLPRNTCMPACVHAPFPLHSLCLSKWNLLDSLPSEFLTPRWLRGPHTKCTRSAHSPFSAQSGTRSVRTYPFTHIHSHTLEARALSSRLTTRVLIIVAMHSFPSVLPVTAPLL